MNKTDDFLRYYKQHFASYQERPVRFLEIGIQSGDSIEYWRNQYPSWDVWGLDISLKDVRVGSLHNLIEGDQADLNILRKLPAFDVIIDDGGHTMEQQTTSFKELFPAMPDGSLYVIEDLHTSYVEKFGNGETMSMLHEIVDSLHWKEANPRGAQLRNVYGVTAVTFYPSIVFISK